MLGPIEKDENRNLKDINKFELSSLIPLLIFIIWIGVYPNTFLKKTQNSVKSVLTNYEKSKVKFGSEFLK
jgi:NADH-quinone oxidoreductase subunit M